MKASFTDILWFRKCGYACAFDTFGGEPGAPVSVHFTGSSKQRRIARRSYIRFAQATCAARGIPLYINGNLS